MKRMSLPANLNMLPQIVQPKAISPTNFTSRRERRMSLVGTIFLFCSDSRNINIYIICQLIRIVVKTSVRGQTNR